MDLIPQSRGHPQSPLSGAVDVGEHPPGHPVQPGLSLGGIRTATAASLRQATRKVSATTDPCGSVGISAAAGVPQHRRSVSLVQGVEPLISVHLAPPSI